MLTQEFSKEFVAFLVEYNEFYKQFLDIETQKFEAISQNNLPLLDQFVTTEQALLLKSRGYDRRRDGLIEKSALEKTISLREIIPQLDKTMIDDANSVFANLSDTVFNLKDINARSNSLTELRLHRVSGAIKQLEKQSDLQKAYSSNAQVGDTPTSFISKKI